MINNSTYKSTIAFVLLMLICHCSAQTGAPFTFLKLFQKPNATAEYQLQHPWLGGGMTLTQRGESYSAEFQTNCTWIEKSFRMGQLFSCTYHYCYRLDTTEAPNHKLYLMGKYYRCPNLVSVRYYPTGVLHYSSIGNGTVFTYGGSSVTNYEILGNSSTVQAHTYDIKISTVDNSTALPANFTSTVIQVEEKVNGTLKQTTYWNENDGLLIGSHSVLINITYPPDPVIPNPAQSKKPLPNVNATTSTSISLFGLIATILFIMLSS